MHTYFAPSLAKQKRSGPIFCTDLVKVIISNPEGLPSGVFRFCHTTALLFYKPRTPALYCWSLNNIY